MQGTVEATVEGIRTLLTPEGENFIPFQKKLKTKQVLQQCTSRERTLHHHSAPASFPLFLEKLGSFLQQDLKVLLFHGTTPLAPN